MASSSDRVTDTFVGIRRTTLHREIPQIQFKSLSSSSVVKVLSMIWLSWYVPTFSRDRCEMLSTEVFGHVCLVRAEPNEFTETGVYFLRGASHQTRYFHDMGSKLWVCDAMHNLSSYCGSLVRMIPAFSLMCPSNPYLYLICVCLSTPIFIPHFIEPSK